MSDEGTQPTRDLRAHVVEVLDVGRLAKALMPRHLFEHDGWICHAGVHEKAALDLAEIIAAEYASLAEYNAHVGGMT